MPEKSVEYHKKKLMKAKNSAEAHTHAHALQEIGTSKAVDALIRTLEHGGTDVAYQSGYALSVIGKPALPALMKLTAHENEDIKHVAKQAIKIIQEANDA